MKFLKSVAVLVVLFMTAVSAKAGDLKLSPALHADILQPSANRQHLTLLGMHGSLLRIGRFRFPTTGVDLQVDACDNHSAAVSLGAGIALGRSAGSESADFNVAFFHTTRDDNYLGRNGVKMGFSLALF